MFRQTVVCVPRGWYHPPMYLATLLALGATAAISGVPSGADLFSRGDFTAAKAAFADTASRNPSDLAALLGLARIELYENDVDAAIKDANAALARDPANATAKRVLETAQDRKVVAASAASLGVPREGVAVPFVEAEPLPAVQLVVDGKRGTFVVDTGAPDLTLDPEYATSLGLSIVGGRKGTFAGGRTAEVKETLVPSVTIGPVTIANVKATVLPSRGFKLYSDRAVDGVIGTVFLSRFLATIDYPHKRLVLRPRSTDVTPDAATTSVTMWLVGDHFIFARGRVNGLTGQLFSIDSGGAGAGFMPVASTIAAAHIRTFPDKAAQGVGGGGVVMIVPTMSDEVCVGDACQRGVPGGYTPSGSPLSIFPFAVAGTVSHEFLERYAVTFDFVRMRMLLSEN